MDVASIELAKLNYRQGEVVTGRAKVKLAGRFAGKIEVRWEDSHGRVIDRVERPAKFPSLQSIAFRFPIDKFPLSVVNRVVVQVTDDLSERRARAGARFTITPPRFAWDDFEVIIWGAKQEWATEAYIEQLKQTGVTAAMAYAIRPGRPRRDTTWLAENDLRFYVENCCQIGWDGKLWRQFVDEFVNPAYKNGITEVPDTKHLVRRPCMNDPAYWAEAKERLQAEVRARDEYMPMAYCIGDEQSIALFTSPYDFCFSEHCLKAFRAWLRKKYRTIGKLNESWDTFFKSWEEVAPMTREEVRRRSSRSYAPWADHRDFMDTQFAALIDRMVGYVHELAPGAIVGIEGTQKPAVYGGFDYWKLMNTRIRFHEVYDIGGSHRIATSFNKNRCVFLGLNGVHQDNRARSWQKLFHGNRGIIIWWLPAFMNPDGAACDAAKKNKDLWNELTGGIAKLLDPEKSVHDGVAIHYSPASIRAHWIMMKSIPVSGDHEIANAMDYERLAWMRLAEDLGYAYRFVSYEQVERGELSDYKVLILPASIALSDAEVRAIRAFVERGGTLIADYQPGLMDANCKWREKGALDDVFGVARADTSTQPFETSTLKCGGSYWYEKVPPLGSHEILVDRNFESLSMMSNRLYYPTVESTLAPTTGTAMAREGNVPAVVVNRFGKGLAVCLNFRLLYYANHRLSKSDQIFAQQTLNVLGGLIGLAGIEPAARVGLGRREIGVERVCFQDGPAEYHCLRRNLEQDHQAGLGEIVGEEAEAQTPINVSLKFRKSGHVYELRSGRYLGLTDSVSGRLEHPEPLIYALLPYKVDALDLDAKAEYARGERVRVRITLFTREKVAFVNHVLRCRLYGPDTLERTSVRQNIVTKTGKATFAFDLAWNEMAGDWRTVVRDVATGIESEHRFAIRPPAE